MSERKNTPLPWSKHVFTRGGEKVDHIVDPELGEWDHVRIAIGSDATLIGSIEADINQSTPCGYPMPKTIEEVRANSDLVLRAVNSFDDLLEAAKFYVANCPQRSWHDDENCGPSHYLTCNGTLCETFRKAIAKAEAPV